MFQLTMIGRERVYVGGMAAFDYGWFSSRITKKTVTNMKGQSPYKHTTPVLVMF